MRSRCAEESRLQPWRFFSPSGLWSSRDRWVRRGKCCVFLPRRGGCVKQLQGRPNRSDLTRNHLIIQTIIRDHHVLLVGRGHEALTLDPAQKIEEEFVPR